MSSPKAISRRSFLKGRFRRSGEGEVPGSLPAQASARDRLEGILDDLNDLSGIWEPPEARHQRRSDMRKTLGLLALTVTLALPTLPATAGEPKPEPNDGLDVWFRSEAIVDVSKQEWPTYVESAAGESKVIERAFPDAPPQIPHTVEDMLPLTSDDNECIECHHPDNVTSKKDFPLPDSHFQRAVMKEGGKGDPRASFVSGYEKAEDVVGTRYRCTMCHVPSATNVKTPATTFERVKAPKAE